MIEARKVAVVKREDGSGYQVIQHGCATAGEAIRRGAFFYVDYGRIYTGEAAMRRAMRRNSTLLALAGWKTEPSFCKN